MKITTTAGQIRQAQRDQFTMRGLLNRLMAGCDLLGADLRDNDFREASDRLHVFLLSLTEADAPVEIEVSDD